MLRLESSGTAAERKYITMTFKKSETKRMVTFIIIAASLLIGMTFIMNDSAFAGDERAAGDNVAVEDQPFFDPFFANNPELDKFFFERDVLGIGGDFEDNPLFQQGNRNAFERDEEFRADK